MISRSQLHLNSRSSRGLQRKQLRREQTGAQDLRLQLPEKDFFFWTISYPKLLPASLERLPSGLRPRVQKEGGAEGGLGALPRAAALLQKQA